jgi:hypothetical protein
MQIFKKIIAKKIRLLQSFERVKWNQSNLLLLIWTTLLMDQNHFFMPIGFMFFHLMHMYVNFQMGHLHTLELSLQTFSSELPTAPKIVPFNPPP